jgi:hypothetical protein
LTKLFPHQSFVPRVRAKIVKPRIEQEADGRQGPTAGVDFEQGEGFIEFPQPGAD